MAGADIRSGALRGVLLTFAVLALFTRIAIPQGFMVAGGEAGSAAQLVICTGHGPLKTSPTAPADKSRPDSPCAFAGHGCGAAPAPPPAVEQAAFVHRPEPRPTLPSDVLPGRGLAAPPPPAQAPPLSV